MKFSESIDPYYFDIKIMPGINQMNRYFYKLLKKF